MIHSLSALQKGDLTDALSIKISEQLETFPVEIFKYADTLEVLDLSGNRLSELPADFGRLKKLKIFFCSNNLFEHLPEVLSDCPELDIVGFKANKIRAVSGKAINANLRWLILTDNQIEELPVEIGNCTRMQKLMLAGNRLTTLPTELGNCRNLGLLRISANSIEKFPDWLLNMPKLSWLAFSGNPFINVPSVEPESLPGVSWNDFEVNQILGSGASGIIYHARHLQETPVKEVAIKVFNGEVTSDGLPGDELAACVAAGNHAGLVNVIGQLKDHPQQRKGLVMDLIPPNYFNLGKPPSLKSCTRDVFDPELRISGKQLMKIAMKVASVANHLHSKRIMHGDLYAHNTRIDDEGNAFLSDFGAASFYEDPLMEKIDVSAYGYFLEDLGSICEESATLSELEMIRLGCHLPDLIARPSFEELLEQLSAIVD